MADPVLDWPTAYRMLAEVIEERDALRERVSELEGQQFEIERTLDNLRSMVAVLEAKYLP